MIEVRVHEALGGPDVRAEWESLVAEDQQASVFHTPRYLQVWIDEFAAGDPRVRTFHRDGRLVGVVPELHHREGSATGPIELIRLLGGEDVTDYRGPVGRREDRADVMAAWVESLQADLDWDELYLAGVPADTAWLDTLESAASGAGWRPMGRETEDVCPRVDVSQGYDAYLKGLSGKERHELKRKARKLSRDIGDVRLVEIEPEHLQDGLDSFFSMARQDQGDKARFFFSEKMRSYFGALADEFGADRTLRMHALEVAGTVGAATVSFVHGREWGLYNSAFDQTLASYAPGMVLVGELIRLAADEGLATFDLLRGDEEYKYRFGAADRPIERLTVLRR